jgi:hypothetical protein
MKNRLCFAILALGFFRMEVVAAQEVFVLDSASQLQTIERKYMQFLEGFDFPMVGMPKCGTESTAWTPNEVDVLRLC